MNYYRSIWISDIHLGTKASNVNHLINFLKHNSADKIYLVGDIIDGWELNKKWYWPKSHNQFLRVILKKSKKTKIIYVPGNHDSFLRNFLGLIKFSSISFKKEVIHKTLDKKKILVTHGDQFDSVRNISNFMNMLGDVLYTLFISISNKITDWRNAKNLPHWSFAAQVKMKSKNVKKYIQKYKLFMVNEAIRNNCDGVICGHIHYPEIETIKGIDYYNDGDWVESLSALVEDKKGKLKLVYWKEIK